MLGKYSDSGKVPIWQSWEIVHHWPYERGEEANHFPVVETLEVVGTMHYRATGFESDGHPALPDNYIDI